MAKAFAQVPAPAHGDAPALGELELADAWWLISLCLPRAAGSLDRQPDIAVPDEIARDSRRRMAFKLGAWSAGELGLDASAITAQDLIALGQQTVADHVMSDAPDSVLVAVARAEGKVDEAAWAARDHEKIAAQVDAFLQSEFKDEIDLYSALEGLATETPPPSRRALADDLLRGHDIDPYALLEGSNPDHFRNNVSASSPTLLRNWKAGEYYFNKNTLTADGIRKMKMRGGGKPTDAHIDKMLRELPASLDAEFTRRFDGHQQRMSTLLSTWLSARLSLHARQGGIDLTDTAITISRAKMQLFSPVPAARHPFFSTSYGTRPSNGFLVSIQSAARTHRCFISNRTGAVHVLPDGGSIESWLRKEHELVFDDAAARAEMAGRPGRRVRWLPRVTLETAASGPYGSIRERLSGMFHAEIEQGRETARGETVREGMADVLLDLIPFRKMIVALRKGDVPLAIVAGGLDALSLVPLIGAGVRFSGAAAKSAAPWLSMGMRLGGAAGRQGLHGFRRLAGRIPALGDRIKSRLADSAIQGWGRLRPLDVRRVAQALRPTAPRLATMLDDVAARARGATIPDGVWHVQNSTVATAGTGEAISGIPAVTAHSLQGNKMTLLPYGEQAGAYTRIDASGQRIGALLVADSGGWLHQTMPVASLERYRVGTLDVVRTLDGKRAGQDGTIVLNDARYARLGGDYVRVRPDHAVSTALRPIWRVAAPPGVASDLIAHRLIYDAKEGLWRQAEVPGLAGGGNSQVRFGSTNTAKIAPEPGLGLRVTPSAAQLARFHDALVAGMRGATPEQGEALRSLLARIQGDRRGQAIMRAMSAHYHLLGDAPVIVLRQGADAVRPRPSLDQPEWSNAWYLDLQTLRLGTTEAAVQELAAVYNNMAGLLQNGDPFATMLANGEPLLDSKLERAWDSWIKREPAESPSVELLSQAQDSAITPRKLAVPYLRKQLREMCCYGGLDKSALMSVLRNQPVKWGVRINLSHRGLDSVPPLPRDMEALVISHNPIRIWSNLPAGLTTLHAEDTQILELPANLPAGLLDLNVSDNFLGGSRLALPPRLVRLNLSHNNLDAMPDLPDSLQELFIAANELGELPAGLPRGLRLIDMSNNVLARVSPDLPQGLKILRIRNNLVTQLPDLSLVGLEELNVSSNRLQALPALSDDLRILEAGDNSLSVLPGDLPRGLEIIVASRNLLRGLPDDLPTRLMLLAVQRNAIDRLPASIVTLESCRIHLDDNPVPIESIPVIPADRAGPRIFFSLAHAEQPSQPARTLSQAVRFWWTQASGAQLRWEAIEWLIGSQQDTREFALFLDRLRLTDSYRDPGFRAQVEAWLVELSKPDRKALLDETLSLCRSSTQGSEDRLVSVWNDMQTLHRNDDIRQGVYDNRVEDAVDLARQVFRINVLTEIARRKEHMLPSSDEIEVYLAYVVRLRGSLGLTGVAPRMRYYRVGGVTTDDLTAARETVLAREREEFDRFLVLDYEPWQTLLKRKDAKAYAEAQAAAHRELESRFEPELRKALDERRLDPNDVDALQAARKTLSPRIMREIRYRVFEPLTRTLLAGGDPA